MISTQADAELAAALQLSLMRTVRRIRSQRVHTEVTLSQLSALATVFGKGPLTAGELAAEEKVQPPSMTKILSGLESAGYVTRTPHPDDRRQSIVRITPSGETLIADETQARTRWLAGRLTDLTADEREVIERLPDILDKIGS